MRLHPEKNNENSTMNNKRFYFSPDYHHEDHKLIFTNIVKQKATPEEN